MRPLPSRLQTVLLAAAAAGSAELMLGVISAGQERPYVAHLGGALLAGQLVAAAVLGLAWHLLRRRPAAAGGAAAALGLTVALSTLTVLGNGLPRRLPPGILPPALGWLLALTAGLLTWAVRRRLPGAGPRPLEAILAAAALVGGYGWLRLQKLPPASPAGMGAWAAMLAAALLLMIIAGRRHAPRPAGRLAWTTVALAALLSVLALAAGRSPLGALPAGRAPGAPDVLLVVLDTARADHVPAPAGSPWPTPAAARLAREGRSLSAVFSTSCWTVPAHGSLFTGRLPAGHGAGWGDPHLSTSAGDTLAQRLQAAGWRTAGFSANPWITAEFGFDRGFGRFIEADADRRPLRPWASAFLPAPLTAPGLDMFEDKGGLALTSEALRFLAEDDPRPAFVFLNLLEPHLPYWPPRRWRDSVAAERRRSHRQLQQLNQDPLVGLLDEAALAAQLPDLEALYAAEIAYADHLLGSLMQRLEQAGRLEGTVLLVTADHGENLGQHPPLDHQLGLYDTLVHVPLLLRAPGAALPEPDRLLSLVDVPGLVLRLAGVPGVAEAAPRDAVLFQYDRPTSYLERMQRRGIDPAPWDRRLDGIRSADAKWIRGSDGRHEAFDLAADPGERRNLFTAAHGSPLADLAQRLDERLPAALQERTGSAAPAIDPRTVERLRSLGYMD